MHPRRTVLVVEDACTMQDEGCTRGPGEMDWDRRGRRSGMKIIRSGKGTGEAGRETVFSQHHPECLRCVGGGFSDHF